MKLFTSFVIIVCLWRETVSKPYKNDTDPYLRPTLRALRSALEFLKSQKENINLDAVIGTRIVEGQLTVLTKRLRKNFSNLKIPNDVLEELNNLQALARYVSEDAIPYIVLRDTNYFTRIGNILERGFWELDYDSRSVNPDVRVWPYLNSEAISEKSSDDCLTEYFGTGLSNHETCSISDKCWEKMTELRYNGYSLTHEVFYLQIGQQFGCSSEMMSKIIKFKQGSIDKLQDTYCSVILAEANKYSNENFPHTKQDLFMEQAALCGMLGYSQFFNTQWLLKILSWQDPHYGCYKASPDEMLLMGDVEAIGRSKREERMLSNECLCHRTTVAAAVLGQYVRYILEAWKDEQTKSY